jgi:flagellar assembly factor FliW
MHILSSRFGPFEVADEAVLDFPDGLIGLPGRRYVLVAREEQLPFYWLHSAEHEEIAVPVTNPWLFFPTYEIRVPDEEAELLGLAAAAEAEVLCVVRAGPEPAAVTINLAAPIVIHRRARLGRQVINDAPGYGVRQPLFAEVDLERARPLAQEVGVQATAV